MSTSAETGRPGGLPVTEYFDTPQAVGHAAVQLVWRATSQLLEIRTVEVTK